MLKETQKTIQGSKESIKLLRDDKDRMVTENDKLRQELAAAEERISELEMERQIREEQAKEEEENEKIKSSSSSLEPKDTNTPSTSLSPEDAKMLLHQIKKREKEQKKREEALKEEIEDLKFQLDKMQTISDFQGHSNPSQKIKHLLKIKEENNQLKKELWKLYTENRKIKDLEEAKTSKRDNIEFFESKAKKYKAELEKKRLELKETMNRASKMCDYILSRPLLPDSIAKAENDDNKLKRAVEAIAFMSRNIQKREKEMIELQREKNELQYTLDVVKKDRDYLKKDLEKKRKH